MGVFKAPVVLNVVRFGSTYSKIVSGDVTLITETETYKASVFESVDTVHRQRRFSKTLNFGI
jgi:hypothetical protein